MMRLVIIKDGTVSVGGQSLEGLDLSQCGLPENFWALQWEERGANNGHIEYDSPLIDNTLITELPAWANACVSVRQTEIDRRAAQQAQQIQAEIDRQTAQKAQQTQEGE
jgi:hypothetical protein